MLIRMLLTALFNNKNTTNGGEYINRHFLIVRYYI